ASIDRNPNLDPPYVQPLEAYENKGDLDGAIAYLSKLSGSHPKNDVPYRYLLVAYKKKGDLDGLRKSVEHHRNYEKAHYWFLLNAYNGGDCDAAIELLWKLIALHPRDERWSRYLVATYDRKGDLDCALSEVRKLMDLYPNSAVLREYLEECTNRIAEG